MKSIKNPFGFQHEASAFYESSPGQSSDQVPPNQSFCVASEARLLFCSVWYCGFLLLFSIHCD